MDPISLIGIVGGIGLMLLAAILEGTHLSSLFAPTALLIIGGGTFGATITCFSLEELLSLRTGIKVAFAKPAQTAEELYVLMGDFATVARREGLLALESRVAGIEYPLLKRGLRLMVDGTDPGLLKDLLITEIAMTEEKMKTQASIFAVAGGFAPCMGIIGTVMGLIHVLGNLSNPDALGPAIAVAFLATLYGIAFANCIFLPLGKKMVFVAKQGTQLDLMIVEGLISIQSGDNPRLVQEKLISFIEMEKRHELTREKAGAGKPAEA